MHSEMGWPPFVFKTSVVLLACRCCSCSHTGRCWARLSAGAAIRQAQQPKGGHCCGGGSGSTAAGTCGWLVQVSVWE